MDLNTVTAVVLPRERAQLAAFVDGDAWLAGGTWLFSEPQPRVRRLVDLAGLEWPALEVREDGLTIAATCTVATLDAFEPPAAWLAAPLIAQCCDAFLASFKIWTMATVGGNLCMGLPAGPMIALCTALDGDGLIWTPDGGERRLPILRLVTGPQQTALLPGEVLRSVDLPVESLRRRTAFRRIALTPLGRSAALLIGTLSAGGDLNLTVTASTRRPLRITFRGMPECAQLAARLETEIPDALYYDDVHGAPAWRRHMTGVFAEEIRAELAGGA
jgi:CO/xanthine dehydrogenase FAD-binding subunit